MIYRCIMMALVVLYSQWIRINKALFHSNVFPFEHHNLKMVLAKTKAWGQKKVTLFHFNVFLSKHTIWKRLHVSPLQSLAKIKSGGQKSFTKPEKKHDFKIKRVEELETTALLYRPGSQPSQMRWSQTMVNLHTDTGVINLYRSRKHDRIHHIASKSHLQRY